MKIILLEGSTHMPMSTKDYVALARILAAARGSDSPDADMIADGIATDFAEYAQQDNPRFDRARFLTATRPTAGA